MHREQSGAAKSPKSPRDTAIPPESFRTRQTHGHITDDQIRILLAPRRQSGHCRRQRVGCHQKIVGVEVKNVFSCRGAKSLVHRVEDAVVTLVDTSNESISFRPSIDDIACTIGRAAVHANVVEIEIRLLHRYGGNGVFNRRLGIKRYSNDRNEWARMIQLFTSSWWICGR